MTAVWNWIKAQWADPSTHAWLVLAAGTGLAYMNGVIDWRSAVASLVCSALGITVPTGHKS